MELYLLLCMLLIDLLLVSQGKICVFSFNNSGEIGFQISLGGPTDCKVHEFFYDER